MELSIVVIFFNMRREARRTLFSLSAAYQRGVSAQAYEVIAIDNGSSAPLDPAEVAQFGPNFRYHFAQTDSVSPVGAMNLGAQMARGRSLAIIVDGARMASPGLIAQSLAAQRIAPGAFVAALAWHLGPDIQPITTQDGYDQATEDTMLAKADWRAEGYRLFDVATMAPSSGTSFFEKFPFECSWFCMDRGRFNDIGGFDARFVTPGGGLCNHEFRNRAVSAAGAVPVVLLGEGLFHQVHGGVVTNAAKGKRPTARFAEEFTQLTGAKYAPTEVPHPIYFGTLPVQAKRFVAPPERGPAQIDKPGTKQTTPKPITAIGGLGGSGTRVFAAMIQHAGVHIGDTLNGPLDNLWFSVLFKRRAWADHAPLGQEVGQAVDLFQRAMTHGLRDTLSEAEQVLLNDLAAQLLPQGTWQTGAQVPHAQSLIDSAAQKPDAARLWGWKEPNTHLFLPHLDRHLRNFRYIHVVRNGLDMAFSQNNWQMRHWSHLFGLPGADTAALPVRQLRYWLAANRRAVRYGAGQMKNRFMVIKYEDFCADPEPYWHQIRRFVGAAPDVTMPQDLIRPTSIGRAQEHDLSIFPQDLLDEVNVFETELDKLARLG